MRQFLSLSLTSSCKRNKVQFEKYFSEGETHNLIKIKLPVVEKDVVIILPVDIKFPLGIDIISSIYENIAYTHNKLDDHIQHPKNYNVVEIKQNDLNENIFIGMDEGMFLLHDGDFGAIIATLTKEQ